MIDKTLIKSTLNSRLKSIDEYVDKNILIDPIDDLIKKNIDVRFINIII